MEEKSIFYLAKELRKFVKNNNLPVVYKKENLIETNIDNFKEILKDFKNQEIVSKEELRLVSNRLSSDSKYLLNTKLNPDQCKEFSNFLTKIYGEITGPEVVSEIKFEELIHVFINKLIISFVYRYHLENLNENVLITKSTSKLELQEFENYNNYKYLASFFDFLSPLTAAILDLEFHTFLFEVETNEHNSVEFLENVRTFYNFLIQFVSSYLQNLKLFRVSLRNERFLIKRSEVKKYNFYESLDELKDVLDREIEKHNELLTQMLGHKKEIVNLIKEGELDNAKILSYINTLIQVLSTFLK